MTEQELIDYYANLLIIQYKSLPKAKSTVEETLRSVIFTDLINQVRNAFSVDEAIGYMQDILGKYIGVSRVITGTTFDREYFGYVAYSDSPPVVGISGYADYIDPAPDVQMRAYEDDKTSLFELTDEEYRFFQRLKIVQNNGNFSTSEIDSILSEIFADQVIFTDLQTMQISYIFAETAERLVLIAQSQDLLPRPMAVGISVSFVPDIEHIFAYGSYENKAPQFAVGYADYIDDPVVGSMASY